MEEASEFSVRFFDINGDEATIYVEKSGGGTIGRKYEGSWSIDIDGIYGRRDELQFRSGTLKSHFDVAMEAYSWYLIDNGE